MKKNKSAKTRKLVLTKESLRKLTLTHEQLDGVVGGEPTRSHGTIVGSWPGG